MPQQSTDSQDDIGRTILKSGFPSGPVDVQKVIRRPRPKRTVQSGNFLPVTRKPKPKTKPNKRPSFVQGPVKINEALLPILVQYGKRCSMNNAIRNAVANCIHQSSDGHLYSAVEIWATAGRWASSLRGQKEFEGVTDRHEAWHQIQKVLFAMNRARNDPMLAGLLRKPIQMYIYEALMSWDRALTKHFKQHPEDLMTPDEYAGMVPAPKPSDIKDISIFRKPKPAQSDVLRLPD